MNSCVLMAKVIRSPELRYTQENQTAVAQMLVEFEGRRPEEATATLKVVGWGNLATQMQENYKEGDRVIIEGRLSINSFDRPEGFKEKRAELVASHIYVIDGMLSSPVSSESQNNVVSMDSFKSSSSYDQDKPMKTPMTPVVSSPPSTSTSVDENLDDIPF
ncbi:single-strand binding protein [Rippkaea orientalis PCC 8801]|uniref:Single-strand binding protein n=1 Tax=Rippkaea orientalis (strain PCC 8801 / RF-1) TaxID=41431 RepID=B7JY83_RIPO1|nr:single-stranded DNA-binding protein [Rippkaea orientalis]ACK67185.1 single-strand binding protein [Rippkaea orientalis PCC 8801]